MFFTTPTFMENNALEKSSKHKKLFSEEHDLSKIDTSLDWQNQSIWFIARQKKLLHCKAGFCVYVTMKLYIRQLVFGETDAELI